MKGVPPVDGCSRISGHVDTGAFAGSLPPEVERKIENIPEVKSATVELVWDPPWSRERMSESALLELGLM